MAKPLLLFLTIWYIFHTVQADIYISGLYSLPEIEPYLQANVTWIQTKWVKSVEECAAGCAMTGRCPFFTSSLSRRYWKWLCQQFLIKDGLPVPDDGSSATARDLSYIAVLKDRDDECRPLDDNRFGIIHVDAAFYRPADDHYYIFSHSLVFKVRDVGINGGLCIDEIRSITGTFAGVKWRVKCAFVLPARYNSFRIHIVGEDGEHQQYFDRMRRPPEFPMYPLRWKQKIRLYANYEETPFPESDAPPTWTETQSAEDVVQTSRAFEVMPCLKLGATPFASVADDSSINLNETDHCAYRVTNGGSAELYYVTVTNGTYVVLYQTNNVANDAYTHSLLGLLNGTVNFGHTTMKLHIDGYNQLAEENNVYGHFIKD